MQKLEYLKFRITLAYTRLEELKSDKSRAGQHEKTMHEHDIVLLNKMIKEWTSNDPRPTNEKT